MVWDTLHTWRSSRRQADRVVYIFVKNQGFGTWALMLVHIYILWLKCQIHRSSDGTSRSAICS
jgi:uncharacterized membrane protein